MDNEQKVVVACPKCGQKLKCVAGGVGTCPKCGERIKFPEPKKPVPSVLDIEEQSEETPKKKKNKKPKKPLIVVLCILIVIGGAFFGVYRYYKTQQFLYNIQQILELSEQAYTACDSISGLASAVWNDAIFEHRRTETSQFVYRNGYHHDFNDALQYFYEDATVSKAVSATRLCSELANIWLGEIDRAPSKYDDLHDKAISLCSYVEQYTELSCSPGGMNIGDFNDRRTELSSACASAYQALSEKAPEPNKDFLDAMEKVMFWKKKNPDLLELA